jgi:hypothetical protein
MRTSRTALTLVIVVLVSYGLWASSTAIVTGVWINGIGGVYSLIAAYGAATYKRWAKPFVYSLGLLLILEWLFYSIVAYRSGTFNPGSAAEFVIALIPGAMLATLVGFCCYIVSRSTDSADRDK